MTRRDSSTVDVCRFVVPNLDSRTRAFSFLRDIYHATHAPANAGGVFGGLFNHFYEP